MKIFKKTTKNIDKFFLQNYSIFNILVNFNKLTIHLKCEDVLDEEDSSEEDDGCIESVI